MNWKLLGDKNFSLLMFGKLISLTGTQMQDFALSLYVLKITGSATLFASVIIVAMIPQLLLSPIAGVFSDWLDRKKTIVYLDLLSGILVGIFATIFLIRGELSLPYIYILVIVLTLTSSLYQPAIGTIIPTIIKKEDLVDANGISSLVMNIGNLLAPLLAGIFFGFYGLFLILAVNCISFLVAALGELFIQIPKVTNMPKEINFKTFSYDFMEGIKFIRGKKLLLYIIILAPILNFVFSPLSSIGITYITKKIFRISDFQYGLMEMIVVASMMFSPFLTSKLAKKYRLGEIIFFDVFISSLLLVVMAIVPSPFYRGLFKSSFIPYVSITFLFFLICMIITTTNIAINAMFQKIVPLPMMGRISTVMGTCCMAIAPLGLVLFGALFDTIRAWICILIFALIPIITILIFKKALCSYDENEDTNFDPHIVDRDLVEV